MPMKLRKTSNFNVPLDLDGRVNAQWSNLIADRRKFHSYPELGWQEFWTATQVVIALQECGFDVRWGTELLGDVERLGLPTERQLEQSYIDAINHGAPESIVESMRGGYTAVVGRYSTGRPGPKLTLRFDIDALPIHEADTPDHIPTRDGFRSNQPGVMHACGHDGHTAIGLAIARLISLSDDDLCGELQLIFQPAEEGVRGGSALAMSGALHGTTHFAALHLGLNGGPTGTVVCGATKLLGTEKLNIELRGKTAHASLTPETGNNAVLAAATITLGLHSIGPHSGGMSRVNVGKIAAGTAANIIGDRAVLDCEIRSESEEIVQWIKRRTESVVEGASAMYNCLPTINIVGRSPAADSDAEMSQILQSAADASPYVQDVQPQRDFGASDDAAELMHTVTRSGGISTYAVVGADVISGHHTPKFDFNEHALMVATDVIARSTFALLSNPAAESSI